MWEGAWDGKNNFTPFFSGTDDSPKIYTPEFLEECRLALGPKRFQTDYPRTRQDLYVQRDIACFDWEQLQASHERTGGKYAGYGCEFYLHGVDTASGNPELDYQACVTYGFRDGMLWEAAPPIHGHWPEDVFAQMVHDRSREFPGTVVVERNMGAAVLVALRQLGTLGLYKHKHRDRTGKQKKQLGFPTTYSSKKILISDLQQLLASDEIGIVHTPTLSEAREFEWKQTADNREHQRLAGAPDRKDAHDDLLMALLMMIQGLNDRMPSRIARIGV
jgi:hypothetical protein